LPVREGIPFLGSGCEELSIHQFWYPPRGSDSGWALISALDSYVGALVFGILGIRLGYFHIEIECRTDERDCQNGDRDLAGILVVFGLFGMAFWLLISQFYLDKV
jgi:hypothetical protein